MMESRLESVRSLPNLRKVSRQFQGPELHRSLKQLSVTFGLFFLAIFVGIAVANHSPYLALLLSPLSALLFLRIFAIQHDCGHRAFFKSNWANEVCGFVCGVFTWMPHQYWWPGHSNHHRTANNLDKQTHPFPPFLMKSEFEALTPIKQRIFRLTRNPYFLYFFAFPIGFSIYYRLPIEMKKQSIKGVGVFFVSNLISIGWLTLLGYALGWQALILAYVPVLLLAGGIGMWLCVIQHVFAGTKWYHDDDWDLTATALEGASFLKIPHWLEWLLANANYHSIHHLAPGVPNYKLRDFAEALSAIRPLKAVSLVEALRSARLIIWDDEIKQLVPCPG